MATINIYEDAGSDLKDQLNRIEAMLRTFISYEVETDSNMEEIMSVASERLANALGEVQELTTVTDGLVLWAGTVTTTLAEVRADLAAKGMTDADLATLDSVITGVDGNVGRLAAVLVAGTDAEGETPVNPVPEPVITPDGTSGDPTLRSTRPDV